MPFQLNEKAVAFAKKLIAMGAVDYGPAIPFDKWATDAILGDDPDWDRYSKHFLGLDPGGEGKEQYVYPIAKDYEGEDPVLFTFALRGALHQAGTNGETEIFKAASELLGLASGYELADGAAEQDGFWVEVLKKGTFIDRFGQEVVVDEEFLKNLETAFSETYPVCKPVLRAGGHELAEPIVGFVSGLKRKGEKLLAKFSQVAAEFRERLAAHEFRDVSSGIWRGWEHEGKVFPAILNHVAILDDEEPAVDGLSPIWTYLSDGGGCESVVITLSKEKTEMTEQEKQEMQALKDQVAELTTSLEAEKTSNKELRGQLGEVNLQSHKSRVETIVDTAVKDGRLLPKDRDDQVEIGLSFYKANAAEFSDAEGTAFGRWKKLMESGPKIVDFSDKAGAGGEGSEAASEDEEYEAGQEMAALVDGE